MSDDNATPRPGDPALAPRVTARRVELTGLLSGARLYWRERERAFSASPVWWDTDTVWPYVIEVDLVVMDAAGREGEISVTLTHPCLIHPESPAALPVWRALIHRAVLHEADEALRVDGEAPFCPHGQHGYQVGPVDHVRAIAQHQLAWEQVLEAQAALDEAVAENERRAILATGTTYQRNERIEGRVDAVDCGWDQQTRQRTCRVSATLISGERCTHEDEGIETSRYLQLLGRKVWVNGTATRCSETDRLLLMHVASVEHWLSPEDVQDRIEELLGPRFTIDPHELARKFR